MVAKGVKIRTERDLRQVLENSPVEWPRLVASRAALRVIPLLLSADVPERLSTSGVRACFISWAAGLYMSDDIFAASFFAAASISPASLPFSRTTAESAAESAYSAALAVSRSTAESAARSAALSASRSVALSAAESAAESAHSATLAVSRYTASYAAWDAIEKDLTWLIGSGGEQPPAALTGRALWHGPAPYWVIKRLRALANTSRASAYGVWINWYQTLLSPDGTKSADFFGQELTIRIATQPDEWWDRPARAINDDIVHWLIDRDAEDRNEPAVTVPEPEPGLTGGIDPDGRIGFARAGTMPADELAATAALRQVLKGAAQDLATLLAGNNSVAIAPGLVPQYLACLSTEPLSIDMLYALGMRLGNARQRLQRQIDRKEDYPDLAPDVGEALDSVLELHGVIVVSTARGRQLLDAATQFHQTAADQAKLKSAAIRYSRAVSKSDKLFSDEVRETVPILNEEIDTGSHPARSTQLAMSTNRNLLIPVAGAALTIVAGNAFAASVPATALTGVMAGTIDAAWAFLTEHRAALWELVHVSGPALQWIEPLLRQVERRLKEL
jgi:hypothetical protein